MRGMRMLRAGQNFVAWKFQEHGPLVAKTGIQAAVNLTERREFILECRRRHRNLFKHLTLRGEVFNTMMQQWISKAFVHSG